MKLEYLGQIPKDPNFPEEIEDAVASIEEDGRVILSDGASESFDSKKWAHLVVGGFSKEIELTEDRIGGIAAAYADAYDPASLPWSKQAAYQRGSFATLLSIEYLKAQDVIRVLGIGDSLAVLLDGGQLRESFPYVNAAQFQQRPELLSTRIEQNSFIWSAEFLESHEKIWHLENIRFPIVLCMTDALGEWALHRQEEGSEVWKELCGITDHIHLGDLVNRERRKRSMRVDDTTLVRLTFKESALNELP